MRPGHGGYIIGDIFLNCMICNEDDNDNDDEEFHQGLILLDRAVLYTSFH
jgi:hypothetical protein